MSTPRELLHRAARNRVAARALASFEPASAPNAQPSAPAPRAEAARPGAQPHHAVYSALMQRHDRARTNHLGVQTPGAGA